MRSLSLESIPVNMNMKLLSLLITMFALSYANSDKKTSKAFLELGLRLSKLENHLENYRFKVHNILVDIQTPRDIQNACDCKHSFAKHLPDLLRSFESVPLTDQLKNIYDNLKHFKNLPDDNCTFKHHRTILTSDNLKRFLRDYTSFTQNWISHCKHK